MKRFILLVFSLVSGIVFGQKQLLPTPVSQSLKLTSRAITELGATDTIYSYANTGIDKTKDGYIDEVAQVWGIVNYQIPDNGGYVTGKNKYGDIQKAQAIFPGDILNDTVDVAVMGVLVHIGNIINNSGGTDSELTLNIYNVDADSTLKSSNGVIGPGEIMHSVSVNINDLDSGAYNYIPLKYGETFEAEAGYYISVDFSDLAESDTVVVSTSKTGELIQNGYFWEQQSTGKWEAVVDAEWYLGGESAPFDAVMLAFPVINYEAVGLGDNLSLVNVQAFPNPVQGNQIQLVFTAADQQEMLIELVNLNGQVVSQKRENVILPGTQHTSFGIPSHVNNGIYLLSVNGKVVQKVEVLR